MKVVVIGAGYVGSVSAACLAQLGHVVVAVDPNGAKIDALNAGQSPVLEPGLAEMIAAGVSSGRLRGTQRVGTEVVDADVALICVPTPSGPGGTTDCEALRKVLEQLKAYSRDREQPLPLAVRSTVRATVLRQLAEVAQFPTDRFPMVVNPEFLRETTAISDFFRPPYLIAGGDDRSAVDSVLSIYESIEAPRFAMDMETASLVKYASNAFHAAKIAFANEIATICEWEGADPVTVMDVFRTDTLLNVSPAYLRPGFAFGGSCLGKDLRALIGLGMMRQQPLHLLSGVLSSNRVRIDQVAALVLSRSARRLAVLGLSFKCGTDDLRESPYVELAERLLANGCDLRIWDPDLDPVKLVGANKVFAETHLPRLSGLLVPTLDEALAGASGVILCKSVLSREGLDALIESGVEIFDIEYHARRLCNRPEAVHPIAPQAVEPVLSRSS